MGDLPAVEGGMPGLDGSGELNRLEESALEFKKQAKKVFGTVNNKDVPREEKQKSLTQLRFDASGLERQAQELAASVQDTLQHNHLIVWANGVKDAAHSFEKAASEVMNSENEFSVMKFGEVLKILHISSERLVKGKPEGAAKDKYAAFVENVDMLSNRVKKVSKTSGSKDLMKATYDILRDQESFTLAAWEVTVFITFGPIRQMLHRATKFTLVLIDKITRACAKGDKNEVKAAAKGFELNRPKLSASVAAVREDEVIGMVFEKELEALMVINNDNSVHSITLTVPEAVHLAHLIASTDSTGRGSTKYKRFVYEAGLESTPLGFIPIKVPASLLADADEDPFDTGSQVTTRRRRDGLKGDEDTLSLSLIAQAAAAGSASHSRNPSQTSDVAAPSLGLTEVDEETLVARTRERERLYQAAMARLTSEKEKTSKDPVQLPTEEIEVPIGEGFRVVKQLSQQLLRSLGLNDLRLGPFVRTYADICAFFGEVANAFLTTTKRPANCERITRKFGELSDACFQLTLALQHVSLSQRDAAKTDESSLCVLFLTLPTSFSTFVSALSEWFLVCREFHDVRHSRAEEPAGGFFDRTGPLSGFYEKELDDYQKQLVTGKELKKSKSGGDWAGVDPDRIVAGTWEGFVFHLTDPTKSDQLFMKALIQGYRSFTSPVHLLNALLDRYHHPILKMFKPSELVASGSEQYVKEVRPMQLRVCQIICVWTDREPFLFNDPGNEALRGKLVNFAVEVDELYPQLAEKIRINITKSESDVAVSINLRNPLQSQLHLIEAPLVTILLDYDLVDLARQLTLTEFHLLQSIKQTELCCLSWSKPALKHLAPNVLAVHSRFNTVSRFFSLCILFYGSSKVRGRVISRCIQLGEHLKQLNNFASLNAITASLHNAAIGRLKMSWAEVSKKEHSLLKEFTALMSNEHSYKQYRAALASAQPPATPFLGVNLTDLTFIEEGNPDELNGMINFSKVEMSYHVIEQVQRYQQIPYDFPVVQPLYSMLASLPDLKNPKILFELSKLREAQQK